MGADLLVVTYVRHTPEPKLSYEERYQAVKLTIESFTEELCESLLDVYGLDPFEEDYNPHEIVLDRALEGLDDVFAEYHRYHTPIASSKTYSIWVAGGTSGGDHPYEGWSSFCLFLDVLHHSKLLANTLGIAGNVNDYLKA